MFNIIGIDPGNNTGVSIISIDEISMEIISIETKTIVLEVYSDGGLHNRTTYLYDYIYNLMLAYDPIMVCLESSFLNIRFPKAVLQLSQYINSIKLAINHVNKYCTIRDYPPKLVKKIFSNSGNSDKDAMLSAMRNHVVVNYINIDMLSEHEVDSLAIGYLGYEELKNEPLLPYITIMC